MKIVLKIGGTLLEDDASRRRMAGLVARQLRSSRQILLVHGGGKQLTAYLKKAGIATEFVNCLRVTSAEALDGVVKIFAGTVNHNLLAALLAAGVPAVGISGIDGGCLLAEKLRGEQGEDWGYVGRITSVNPRVWEALLAADLLPVMACLAAGEDGQIYNINADQAAVACAVHWQADSLDSSRTSELTMLNMNHPELPTWVRSVAIAAAVTSLMLAVLVVSAEEIPALARSGAITGGMLAKLNAIQEALTQGVREIHIRNGHRDDVLHNIFSGGVGMPRSGQLGTVIVSSLAVGKKN